MADEEKGDEAAPGPTVFVGSDGLDWSCRLTEVQRIEADPEDDDLEDLFAVTFAVDGPNAEAEIEIMVADATDLEVVEVALETLHGALLAWAELIQRRREAARTELPKA